MRIRFASVLKATSSWIVLEGTRLVLNRAWTAAVRRISSIASGSVNYRVLTGTVARSNIAFGADGVDLEASSAGRTLPHRENNESMMSVD